MRVLINGISAVAGGGVTYLMHLSRHLPVLDPESSFIFALPEGLPFPEHHPKVSVLRIAGATRSVASRLFWENTSLIRLCREHQVDVLYCPSNVSPRFSGGIPVVVCIQNVAPWYPRVRRLTYAYEGLASGLRLFFLYHLSLSSARHASEVIVLSKATRALARRYVPHARYHVIYHGHNESFRPGASRPKEAPTGDFFVFVSNIYAYKGLEYLIDALQSDPSLPPIVVLGRPYDLAYFTAMRQRAEHAGVLSRLHFQDAVPYDDLPKWYGNARGLVYTSWCENCPNILIEALSCACPVIAMNYGPMPEICGDAGFYCRPFDAADLARAMRDALRDGFTDRSRRQAVDRAAAFTWREACRRHLAIFQTAAGGASGGHS